jgi:hypothetical protein
MFQKLVLTAVVTVFALSSSAFAQDRYSLTLNNEYLTNLKASGSLKSEVSESARNKIGFIELRYDDSKDKTPIELDVDITRSGPDAVIVLDNELIAKIKGQPVRIPARENGFSRVLLKYDAPAVGNASSEIISEDLLFIRLSDVKSLAGELDEITEITMTTKFGDVTIPMEQIAGIKLHTDEDDSAVVVMVDGDVLTGVPSLPTLQLSTDWGKAEINPEAVQSITTTSNSKFSRQNTDFGTRWTLRTGNSFAPGM